jgi:hypothetical protein
VRKYSFIILILGFDSERSHSLDLSNLADELRQKFNLRDSWLKLEPVQPPTEPSYKHSVSLKRSNQLAQPAGLEEIVSKLSMKEE